MKELDLIRWIRDRSPADSGVLVGIGDDAAVLEASSQRLVVTTDLIVEGTHFEDGDEPRRIGRKSLAVSISDIAAMGCRGVAAFVAVALRRGLPDDYPRELFRGIRDRAEEFGIPLAGGDTTETTGPVTICTTLVGQAPEGSEPVLRGGASPGETLLVTGMLGGSRGGRHLDFVPRLREALELVARFRPGAMIDLSDGLSTDAAHLARESGVRLRIRQDRLPATPGAGARGALDDGEDFELLFTLPAVQALEVAGSGLAGTTVTAIGDVLPGPAGVLLADAAGNEEILVPGGFEHLA